MPNKEFYKQQLKNEIEQRAYNKLTQEEKDTIQKAEKIIGENQPLWRVQAARQRDIIGGIIKKNQIANEKLENSIKSAKDFQFLDKYRNLSNELGALKKEPNASKERMKDLQNEIDEIAEVREHYQSGGPMSPRVARSKYRIDFDPEKDLTKNQLDKYNDSKRIIEENQEKAKEWDRYIELKEKTLFPGDNEVCSYAVDEYTKAKQEYEKLGFFGRLWGRIMPSSISKNAEIYEKMKGFEEVLSEKSIDPEYVETFQKIQTNADDRTPMPELEEELNKGEKTLVTGEKELGMIMETEKVTEVSPEMGGGVK